MLLPLTATALRLEGREIATEPLGEVTAALTAHLAAETPGGLVLLGAFGSGKSTLCARLALVGLPGAPPCTAVPIRVVARHQDLRAGLAATVGPARLAEARAGERILLLDGLDEVGAGLLGDRTYSELFHTLTEAAGPSWILTCRPGWFRTGPDTAPDQVDALSSPDVQTWVLDPLPPTVVREHLSELPHGRLLLRSVEGMLDLATSPVLFQALVAALPFIEPGRPIQPWGVFDAWLRHALSTGPRHDEAMAALEQLAWKAFEGHDHHLEVPLLSTEEVARARLPESFRRALFVNELTGGLRFGHRSVFEFLLASRIAPSLGANQGHGPDRLTGLRLTDAMRAFLVGRCGRMGVGFDRGATRACIPRGNFVAGGDAAPDERPLRIAHLERPFWIARAPVTHAEWQAFREATDEPPREDAHYLTHWGPDRILPAGLADAPVYDLWPEDAERYAAHAGARLPTADEWEKAVRGLDGRRWPWGEWWRPWAVTAELGVDRPLDVRALGATGEAGLFAAVGGVFEYTASPWRGREGRGRIVMGGCFTHPARTARPSLRLSHTLSGHLKAGLRLAWDVEG